MSISKHSKQALKVIYYVIAFAFVLFVVAYIYLIGRSNYSHINTVMSPDGQYSVSIDDVLNGHDSAADDSMYAQVSIGKGRKEPQAQVVLVLNDESQSGKVSIKWLTQTTVEIAYPLVARGVEKSNDTGEVKIIYKKI